MLVASAVALTQQRRVPTRAITTTTRAFELSLSYTPRREDYTCALPVKLAQDWATATPVACGSSRKYFPGRAISLPSQAQRKFVVLSCGSQEGSAKKRRLESRDPCYEGSCVTKPGCWCSCLGGDNEWTAAAVGSVAGLQSLAVDAHLT